MLDLDQIILGTGILMIPYANELTIDIRFAKFICFMSCFALCFFVIDGAAICYFQINILEAGMLIAHIAGSIGSAILMTKASLGITRRF